MDALKSTANQTLTWNGSPAFESTGSAMLDAFQHLNRYASWDIIDSCLSKAWEEDPALTLRLIWNTRSIHDGKSEKELFYQAYAWLYKNHPRTAITNLPQLVAPVCKRKQKDGKRRHGASHGYWKDLLNILLLATSDELGGLAARVAEHVKLNAERKAKAKAERAKAAAEAYGHLERKLKDKKYRALYIAVARLFADKLAEDLQILQKLRGLPDNKEHRKERSDLLWQLSLAGKWAPTPGQAHDRRTNIATAVCYLLRESGHIRSSVPPQGRSGWQVLETHIFRSYYQRWVLTPLRAALRVPEPLMSANRWTEIQYNRVPSVCMNVNMVHFARHDRDGFLRYMVNVESGKKTISGATLMPYEVVKGVMDLEQDLCYEPDARAKKPSLQDVKKDMAEMKLRVLEGQWKSLVARLRESGAVENSLAVCDVSGSMMWANANQKNVQPIYPAIALSLILAQLGKPPFNNGFITFSANPKFVQVDVETNGLRKSVQQMVKAEWGMNTNLHAVFVDLLLPLAIKNEIRQEDMIKRLFIFSDMQFDSAEGTSVDPADWQTNHDAIEKAYHAAGYEMPEIVYWNLCDCFASVPVEAERTGVALMSGFSSAMLKTFMGEDDESEQEDWIAAGKEEFNPINIMKKILSRASYDGLVIVD
ncbi:hypothetical protein GLOTRDRAFT_106062 [Gloeophyllum trabeum ATCC 11539]|uniref:Uncharacterized protein n=1 Tax=Gloeophyllum trabeum (strain ATCC 11539 / FP-39264 / Madison 617) TaxID=670483 RepID=S7Q768_GLOTA|nr:uncharacterized protein GLOTRDRAFT_106062 [Gloeophyllum trabeum ATCC 11539]EPQ55367.1 hypothetical protein GLOTRDRAFT_106062 [Gloeophyllum trabeum ATCC 11539]